MSSPDSGTSVSIPDEYREWLRDEADRREVHPAEFLTAIIAAYRVATTDADAPANSSDNTMPRLATQSDLDALETEFTDLIEDVRSRVIQVKRETDTKAPADHEHPALAEQLTETSETVTSLDTAVTDLEADLQDLQAALSAVQHDMTAGFENYEEILEYLVETTDTLQERLDTLAKATLATRQRLRETVGNRKEQQAVQELKSEANKHGVEVAKCQSCNETVHLGLLTSPHCPHCSSVFTDVDPATGLRGIMQADILTTGDRPALTGRQRPAIDDEIEAELDSERPDPESIDWEQTHKTRSDTQ